MPTLPELKASIDLRKNSRPVLKAVELVSINRRTHTLEEIKEEKPHQENIYDMMNQFQERYPDILASHPYTVAHPELPATHIILISMENGLFCQPPLNHLLDYLRSNHADETVTFTPVGPESHKLLTRLHEISPPNDEELEQLDLIQKTQRLTDIIQSVYLHNGVGSVRIINIQNNLEPKDFVLLPIPLPGHQKHSVLNHDGQSNAAVDMLIRSYIKTVLYEAILETQEAEHLSRMLAAHRAVENIDETLPEIQLFLNQAQRDKTTKQILELSQ